MFIGYIVIFVDGDLCSTYTSYWRRVWLQHHHFIFVYMGLNLMEVQCSTF